MGLPAFASAASAQGFGQRYDLPIPLSFYLWGADATVALSFVFLVVFFTSERAIRPLPTLVVQLPPMLERTLRLVCSTVGLRRVPHGYHRWTVR